MAAEVVKVFSRWQLVPFYATELLHRLRPHEYPPFVRIARPLAADQDGLARADFRAEIHSLMKHRKSIHQLRLVCAVVGIANLQPNPPVPQQRGAKRKSETAKASVTRLELK